MNSILFKNKKAALESILWILAVALGVWSVFGFVYSAALKLGFPYMINLGEPALSQNIRYFHEGRMPYHDLRFPPYSLVPYGPVYLALAGFLRIFWDAPFVSGRVVGFAASLTAAFLCFVLLRKEAAGLKCSFIVFFLTLLNPYVQRWGVQVNVDMTAVMLGAAALYSFYLFIKNENNFYFGLGVVLSAAAFFTKSSAISAGAAFFLYLLLTRRFRLAFVYAFLQASLLAAVYFLLYRWTDGQYFFHTSYEISRRFFFPELIARYWFGALKEVPLFIFAGIVFFIWGFGKKRYLLFYLYLLISLFLTVSLGKQGSDTNYFLEWCVASVIALGLVLQESRAWTKCLLLGLIVIQAAFWAVPVSDWRGLKARFEENKNFYDKISVNIRNTPGEILSEDMGLLVANGKEVVYEPFPMGQMSYSGAWDENIILKKLNDRDFSLAILYFYAPALRANRTFTPKFLEAFKKNYHFIGRVPYPWDKSKNPQNLFFYAPNKGD